jgi:outer membrane protein assembly factor BamB
VLDGETLYTPTGGVTAVKLGSSGPVGMPVLRAKEVQLGMPSPLVYLGRVYGVNGQGIVSCVDTKTGKLLYKERLKGAYSASPIAGDGKIYLLSETGVCTVLNGKSDEFDILATNEIGEEGMGTPAIAGGRIFIRTDKALYAVGK